MNALSRILGIMALGAFAGCSSRGYYLPPPPAALDPVKILSSPPVEGSAAYKADFKALQDAQKTRTPQDCTRAMAEVQLSIDDFAEALPKCFQPQARPALEVLFKQVDHDERPYIGTAKIHWGRPRPYVIMPMLKPCVPFERSTAYPSGHSTRAMLYAGILAEIDPSHREAIFARAREISQDRVIAGVHHPSDVEAGKKLGLALSKAFLANDRFKKALAHVRELCSGKRQR